MLTDLFPHGHNRYTSLLVLSPILEDYARWLFEQGYPRHRVRIHIRTAWHLDHALRGHGARSPSDLNRQRLDACAPADSQDDPELAALIRCLRRFLECRGILPPLAPPTVTEQKTASYRTYLEKVRGLAPSTIGSHLATASRFLTHLGYESDPSGLARLTAVDIEAFVQQTGQRIGRASLQHVVAGLRSLLRFMAARGEVPNSLDTQIDTARVYRGEQLPRALPWATVCALLRSIDRSRPLGRRDYAIFLLMATYGLRASEIAALRLDDIEWRVERIRVSRPKIGTPLLLPLTDEVGASLVDYLQRGRPSDPHREMFLRGRAPAGVLKPTAVTEAFQGWSRRSGLRIPFQGAHCLRHSYAVHLLRQGASLKTIGDILGHRNAESTCVYLRLAVEDLRDVALSLPRDLAAGLPAEVRP